MNMAEKNPKKLTCVTFLCMIALRNKTFAYFASIVRQCKWPSRSRKIAKIQGPVARSLVSANRWLRSIKMYRFRWYLTLVSTNHASSNPGQKFFYHGNVTSHFSSLLTELWKTTLGYPRGFAPHYCLNRYVYAKNNKNNNNWYKPAHHLGLCELIHHLATNLHIFAVLFDFQGDINNVNRLFFLCSVRLMRERKHINGNLNLLRSKRKIQNGIWHKLTGM